MKRRGFFKAFALAIGVAATGRLSLAKRRSGWFVPAFKASDGYRDTIFHKREFYNWGFDKHPLRIDWKDCS